MSENLVGKIVEGQYKRAGRPSTLLSLEVTAHVKLSDSRGAQIPYLFGTCMGPANAGNVMLVRSNCFRKANLKVTDAKDFKAIDLKGWYVTPPDSDNASFAFVEKVEDRDVAWSEALGGRPLADFVVKAEAAKA